MLDKWGQIYNYDFNIYHHINIVAFISTYYHLIEDDSSKPQNIPSYTF